MILLARSLDTLARALSTLVILGELSVPSVLQTFQLIQCDVLQRTLERYSRHNMSKLLSMLTTEEVWIGRYRPEYCFSSIAFSANISPTQHGIADELIHETFLRFYLVL